MYRDQIHRINKLINNNFDNKTNEILQVVWLFYLMRNYQKKDDSGGGELKKKRS